MNIGKAIKIVRRKRGVQQKDLADICLLSQTSISQIETGVKNPSQKTIERVCDALDIPECMLYMIALQEVDIAPSKRQTYRLLYPTMVSLILEVVNTI